MKFKICLCFWGVFEPWRGSAASYTTDERAGNGQKERWRLNLEELKLQFKSSSEKFRRLQNANRLFFTNKRPFFTKRNCSKRRNFAHVKCSETFLPGQARCSPLKKKLSELLWNSRFAFIFEAFLYKIGCGSAERSSKLDVLHSPCTIFGPWRGSVASYTTDERAKTAKKKGED